MIRFRSSFCILAALATAALARSQGTTVTTTGAIVIERGDDRIEVRLQPGGAHPTVTVNGKPVPTREWQAEDGKHSVRAGDWHITTTPPSGGWQLPLLYSWGGQDAGKAFQYLTPDNQGLWRNYVRAQGKTGEARPHIGVQVGSVPPALAEHLGLDTSRCVLILSAIKDGPAAKAGIRANDILVAIDGADGVTDEALSKAVAGKQAGDKMSLRILRKGRKQEVEVEVGKEAGANRFGLDLLRNNDDVWRAFQKTPLTYTTSPWAGYRNLFGQKGEGGEEGETAPAKATVESLQRQLDQIKQLCDRLEKQLDRNAEKGSGR